MKILKKKKEKKILQFWPSIEAFSYPAQKPQL